MAEVNFSVTGEGIEPISAVATIAAGDVPRVFAYLAATEYGVVTLDDGTTRPATSEEAAKAFAMGLIRGLMAQVVRWERDEAARAAAAGVLEIEVD